MVKEYNTHPAIDDHVGTHDQLIKKYKGKYAFVKVYAPWCGHCITMTSDIIKLGNKVKNTNFKVITVNSENSENSEIISKLNIGGFPSLYILHSNSKFEKYTDDRSYDEIYKHVKKYIKQKKTSSKKVKRSNKGKGNIKGKRKGRKSNRHN